MKHQFGPLTQQEYFFGVNRTFNGNKNFMPKAVVPPTQFEVVVKPPALDIPTIASTASNTLAAPNNDKILLTNILWKYRWEIAIATVVVVGIGIYAYSQKKKEEESFKKF
jgi:hypothetical protein